MPTTERRPRVTILGVLVVLTLLTAVVCGILIVHTLEQSTNPLFSLRADVEVPNCKGRTRAEIEADTQAAQLSLVWREVTDAYTPAGQVCAQQPAAGRSLKAGQQLVLSVSTGPDVRSVPDVRGMERADALETVRQAGFTTVVEFLEDNTVSPYTALYTRPAAGTEGLAGDSVTIVVTTPVADAYRNVPNVIGMSIAQARNALWEVGLQPIAVPAEATEGTVRSQTPLAGTLHRVNTKVYCTVG